MGDTTTYAIFGLILWAIAMFSPEFAGQVTRNTQLNEVRDYAVQLTSKHGGYTSEVNNKVIIRMKSYGLDPAVYRMTTQPPSKVEFQESFDVVLEGQYTYKVFNLLGTGLGNFSVPIKAQGPGLGQVYYR